jgi:hypothetical protein
MPWYSTTADEVHATPAEQRRPRKRMFKWLVKQFTSADEDPDSLGSETGLRAFLDGLPTTIPARTVEALGEPFEGAPALELTPAQLRRALMRLDERAQEPLELVWKELFADTLGREISDTAWLTLARYYRNVHMGYRVCLDAIERSTASENERGEAVLMACRAVCALGRHKQLLRLRYRDVDAQYWQNLNGLIAWSGAFGGSSTLVELYPKSGYQSSIEREYLIALLFDVAPIANLLPTQMAALDLVLRRYGANYQFSPAYREATPFVVDPARAQSAQRYLKGLPLRPGHSFFGVGTAYAQIASLRKEANVSSAVPEWLASTRLDTAAYRALLDLLLAHWSHEPPQRRQRRDRGEGEVMITHGVGQVRRMIAASEFAKSGGQLSYQDNTPYDYKLFDRLKFGTVADEPANRPAEAVQTPMAVLQKFELEGDRQMTERWTISDLSAQGLGTVVSAHAGWARVGMLVGFRRLDSLDWQIAVIRRLGRTAQGKLSIGMQTIHGATACARLRFGENSESNNNPWVAVTGDGGESFRDTVLLRADEQASLLLDPGVFIDATECMLSVDKRWHKVRLDRSLETGYDYERVLVAFA